jgi:hypothetical protein
MKTSALFIAAASILFYSAMAFSQARASRAQSKNDNPTSCHIAYNGSTDGQPYDLNVYGGRYEGIYQGSEDDMTSLWDAINCPGLQNE